MKYIKEINKKLVYEVWEKDTIDNSIKLLLKELVNNRFKNFYNRKIFKEVIHMGLDSPDSHDIGNQSLMFGPAGNLPFKPEIIITGISTSVTAANKIALDMRTLNYKDISIENIRNIYLKNIYRGRMYGKFKNYWESKIKNTKYESIFRELFLMIETKEKLKNNFNIMVTQLTLHGVATYFNDKRHNCTKWGSPSKEIFNNETSEKLYNCFFIEKVLKERFLNNPMAKCLFVMGMNAYKKVHKTLEGFNLKDSVKLLVLNDKDFNMDCLIKNQQGLKGIYEIRHAAS